MKPIQIKVIDKKELLIKWDEGEETKISLKKLRENCPCATCVTFKERQGEKYIPILHDSQTSIKTLNTVGSYAISITWNDGHNTGIYEFPFLQNLAEKE